MVCLSPGFPWQDKHLAGIPMLDLKLLWDEHWGVWGLALYKNWYVCPISSLLGPESGDRLWLRTGNHPENWKGSPRDQRASHLLGFLPSVWGLVSVSASLSSSVGLWGSERGNAVFSVSTIALTTICRGQRCRVRQKPPNEQLSYGALCNEDEQIARLASGAFSSA